MAESEPLLMSDWTYSLCVLSSASTRIEHRLSPANPRKVEAALGVFESHVDVGELTRVLDLAGRHPAAGELGFVGDGWVELAPSHALAGNPMRFRSGRVPLRVDEEWRGQLRRRHRGDL